MEYEDEEEDDSTDTLSPSDSPPLPPPRPEHTLSIGVLPVDICMKLTGFGYMPYMTAHGGTFALPVHYSIYV